MGNGYYDSDLKAFQLAVEPQFDIPEAILEEWRISFAHASKLLYTASDGHMRFGTIRVVPFGSGSRIVDAHLLEDPGASSTQGHLQAIGEMTLCGDERFSPFIILHEFGHYAFHLGEEYDEGYDKTPQCLETPGPIGACIMAYSRDWGMLIVSGVAVPGQIYEFCSDDSPHNDHPYNNHNEVNEGKSCWTVVQKRYPDIPIPDPQPRREPSEPPAEIVWEKAVPGWYSLVAVDLNSATLEVVGTATLAGLLNFEYAWTGDAGKTIVVGAAPQNIVLTDRAGIEPLIHIISKNPDSRVDVEILGRLISEGAPFANPSFKWVSDRGPTSSGAADAVGRLLRKSWHRFDGLGVIPNAQPSDLQRVVDAALGNIQFVSPTHRTDFPVRFASDWLAGTIGGLAHTELIAYHAGTLPEGAQRMPTRPAADRDQRVRVPLVPVARRKIDPAELSQSIDIPVLVEAKARSAIFALSRMAWDAPRFFVRRPDGTIVGGKDPDVSMNWEHERFHVVRVKSPSAGRWFFRLERETAEVVGPFHAMAYSENPEIRVVVSIDAKRSGNFARVTITGTAACPMPAAYFGTVVGSVFRWNPEGHFDDRPFERVVLQPWPAHSKKRKSTVGAHGVLAAEVELPAPGLYLFEVRVENPGLATPINLGAANQAADAAAVDTIGPFVRIFRRQVYLE